MKPLLVALGLTGLMISLLLISTAYSTDDNLLDKGAGSPLA